MRALSGSPCLAMSMQACSLVSRSMPVEPSAWAIEVSARERSSVVLFLKIGARSANFYLTILDCERNIVLARRRACVLSLEWCGRGSKPGTNIDAGLKLTRCTEVRKLEQKLVVNIDGMRRGLTGDRAGRSHRGSNWAVPQGIAQSGLTGDRAGQSHRGSRWSHRRLMMVSQGI